MPKPYPPEIVAEILADRAAGVSTAETAKRLGITPAGAYNVLKRASIERRPMKQSKHASDELKSQIRSAFEDEGRDIQDIARRFGRSTANIRTILQTFGCSTPTRADADVSRRIKTPEEERRIVAEYTDISKRIGLSERWNLPDRYLYRILKRHGVDADHRQIAVREDAFDLPISPDAAYWAGFISADGYVKEDDGHSPRLQFNLATKDEQAIQGLIDFLSPARKIGVSHEGSSRRVEIRSRRLIDALSVLGIENKKSNREHAGDAVAMNEHFWRGYMDGDGCYRATSQVTCCGSKEILTQLAAWGTANGMRGGWSIAPVRGTHVITFNSEAAFWIANRLKTGRIALDRKQSDIDEFLARRYGRHNEDGSLTHRRMQ